MPNTITHYVNSDHTVDILKKRESLSSLENEVISENTKTDEKEELHLNGEVGDITADALDTWLSTDSKWRQSPEGGEDSTHSSNIVRKVEEAEEEDEDNSASLASSSVHLELLEPKQLQQSSGSSSPIVPREKKSRHKKKVHVNLCSKQKLVWGFTNNNSTIKMFSTVVCDLTKNVIICNNTKKDNLR